MMKNLLPFLFCFWVIPIALTQDLSDWNQTTIDKANTAKNSSYHTEKEKEIILLMNLARIDGSKFYETVALPYMEDLDKNAFTKSLTSTLKKSKSIAPLTPDKALFDAALYHAKKMGKAGGVGHDNYQNRMKDIQENYYGLGENCDYGFDDPLTIVMRLLIDEGNPNYGHRTTILDPNFKYIGVSIQPHTKWNFNCVQEFGGEKF